MYSASLEFRFEKGEGEKRKQKAQPGAPRPRLELVDSRGFKQAYENPRGFYCDTIPFNY